MDGVEGGAGALSPVLRGDISTAEAAHRRAVKVRNGLLEHSRSTLDR